MSRAKDSHVGWWYFRIGGWLHYSLTCHHCDVKEEKDADFSEFRKRRKEFKREHAHEGAAALPPAPRAGEGAPKL